MQEEKITLIQLCVHLPDEIVLKQLRATKSIRKLEWPPESLGCSAIDNHILIALKVEFYK